MLGSIGYMSPEQVRARHLDARTDLFSFGVLLYEMAAGRMPFEGASPGETCGAILHLEPAPLSQANPRVPPGLEAVIRKALEKDRDLRYHSAAEVRTDLQGLQRDAGSGLDSAMALDEAAAGAATRGTVTGPTVIAAQSLFEKSPADPSIAVLPFANLSADKENEYFSDGLAEEILNLLTKVSGLKVIARTSSFMFRDRGHDVRAIAETLNVRTILEGSVRRAGSRIRITAQLIDALGGHQVWSERYDRELTDVFGVQDEIAAAIAGALRLKFAAEPAIAHRRQPTIPAYEAWLKGRHYSRKVTPDAMARSKEYFEQAIALDPDFAEAHADLGGNYLNLWTAGLRPGKDVIPLVRAEAQRAVELYHSAGHVLLGTVAIAFDYNWKDAEAHFNLFLSSGENKEEARATSANYYLSPFGRVHEAVEAMEQTVESDPLSVRSRAALGNHLTIAGRYEDAICELRKALEIDDHLWFVHAALARGYFLKAMMAEALGSAELAHRLAPWNAIAAGQVAALLVRTGERSRGEALMREFLDSPNARSTSIGMLFYHLICEETEGAAGWFEKAIEEREPTLIPYLPHPLMKPLRTAPRWPVLAKMMNLPQSIA